MSKSQGNQVKRVQAAMNRPENAFCADCHAKDPRWASAKLGVFICANCSGCHRDLGTHISFVRSCTLDKWTEEQCEIMERVGNAIGNKYWEANLPPDFKRPSSEDRPNLERFIRNKYEKCLWVDKNSSPPHLLGASETHKKKKKSHTVKVPQVSHSASSSDFQTASVDLLGISAQPQNASKDDLLAISPRIPPKSVSADPFGFQPQTPTFDPFEQQPAVDDRAALKNLLNEVPTQQPLFRSSVFQQQQQQPQVQTRTQVFRSPEQSTPMPKPKGRVVKKDPFAGLSPF